MIKRLAALTLVTLAAASIALVASSPTAQADEVYTFVIKKQEEKAKSRWSLSEWIDTRDRMRMMDLWLALHSPSPYEFFVGANYRAGDVSGVGSYSGINLALAAYASIFGLGLERESGFGTRYDGTFHLRFFGYHYQATHMRLEAGLRHESINGAKFQNALVGAGLTVYLAKFFGIDARWRHSFGSTPNATGLSLSGDQLIGGAFLDFSFVRVFGQYAYEKGSSPRAGPEAGIKLFF